MMKKLVLLLTLLMAPALSWAAGNTITLTASGAPTGSCAFVIYYIDSATGNFYDCLAGSWHLAGAGGSTVSITATAPIVITPSPTTGTGVISCPSCSTSAGAMVQLETHTASASATLDFTTCTSSSYHAYRLIFKNILPSTTGSTPILQMVLSTDGGSTWNSGSNYTYADFLYNNGGTSFGGATAAASNLTTNGVVNTAANGGVSGWLEIDDPLNGASWTKDTGQFSYYNATTLEGVIHSGAYIQTTAVNAYRFLFSTGNITSGTITCYGITP